LFCRQAPCGARFDPDRSIDREAHAARPCANSGFGPVPILANQWLLGHSHCVVPLRWREAAVRAVARRSVFASPCRPQHHTTAHACALHLLTHARKTLQAPLRRARLRHCRSYSTRGRDRKLPSACYLVWGWRGIRRSAEWTLPFFHCRTAPATRATPTCGLFHSSSDRRRCCRSDGGAWPMVCAHGQPIESSTPCTLFLPWALLLPACSEPVYRRCTGTPFGVRVETSTQGIFPLR